jgi:hypothetical protein
MKLEEFGLKPPHNSYVDMIEHMSDGVVVDVVTRNGGAEETATPGGSVATGRENNRPSSRSNRGERD